MKKFDIIIIGGGMVGAAIACALQNTAYRVALVDAATLLPTDDARLIALNDSSVCLLSHLTIWDALAPHAAPIKQIHVSQRGQFGALRIKAEEAGLQALGQVVPAHVINEVLYAALTAADNITLFRPAELKTLDQDEHHVTLCLKVGATEETVEGALVIGADGSYSTVRDLLGITTHITDYQQSALVTITQLQRSHDNIAYERFQEQGAIAMLPLPNERAATIWTAPNAMIAELLRLSDADFIAQLQKKFGYRLGRLLQVTKRVCYPLNMIRAAEQKKGRVLLLGNAAHTIHPIAAQGLNLALYEVAMLIDYLTGQTPDTLSIDHLPTLTSQQQFSTQLSHRLTWIFSSDLFVISKARQAGLIGLDLCAFAKKKFIQGVMGRTGIPRVFC